MKNAYKTPLLAGALLLSGCADREGEREVLESMKSYSVEFRLPVVGLVVPYDWNGDGKADIFHLKDRSGSFTTPEYGEDSLGLYLGPLTPEMGRSLNTIGHERVNLARIVHSAMYQESE